MTAATFDFDTSDAGFIFAGIKEKYDALSTADRLEQFPVKAAEEVIGSMFETAIKAARDIAELACWDKWSEVAEFGVWCDEGLGGDEADEFYTDLLSTVADDVDAKPFTKAFLGRIGILKD